MLQITVPWTVLATLDHCDIAGVDLFLKQPFTEDLDCPYIESFLRGDASSFIHKVSLEHFAWKLEGIVCAYTRDNEIAVISGHCGLEY